MATIETQWQYIIGRCWHTPKSVTEAREYLGIEWPDDETQTEQWEQAMRFLLANRHARCDGGWLRAMDVCMAGWQCSDHGLALTDVLAEEWATEKWAGEAPYRRAA